MKKNNLCVAVIGLGYVGLPLAVRLAKKYPTIGYDIDQQRIIELNKSIDRTGELDDLQISSQRNIFYTSELNDLSGANFFIVTVPTPIDDSKRPDFSALRSACLSVATIIKKGATVVFESTVYPGATEEVCVPILEEKSRLRYNKDFFVGYSPERINPGDKNHPIESIIKVTSGSTPETANLVNHVYSSVIDAGTHKATSIKVAEAAKVIENTQRDINIALINELALIFDKLGLDTGEVLEAAETKWNFIGFRPGLVGGHCIGVDPYYLTYRAQLAGYQPEIILAGRRLNDDMGKRSAQMLLKILLRNEVSMPAKVLILGFTFKENCPDIRNTKVIDMVRELEEFNIEVTVSDPVCQVDEVKTCYGINLEESPALGIYDAVVLAVPHETLIKAGPASLRAYGKPTGHIFFDLKAVFDKCESDIRL